ncbi:putative bifunctional diguanylate cyclase/phosphodiesterase [Hamadaea tsunoensis]|uniref:putative bifunctional diguanylate cyclase/phosphodiesterase n=1 Tax=Hamadaea tsunoensis TaxID=53368 RepID=UPI0007E8E6B2
MTVLSLLAAVQAFVAVDPRGSTVVSCPTLCFTFAILLCWGVAPALLIEAIAVALVAARLRHTAAQTVLVIGQYAVAFGAAYAVLVLGDPHPFTTVAVSHRLLDALTVALAGGAFLAVYSAMVMLTARLRLGRTRWRRVGEPLKHQTLFKASLVLLSPVLAVSAHVNQFFVLLILVPIFAVQRMARLSAERDFASRVDPLTGLANRRTLQIRFADMVNAPVPADQAAASSVALLMLDLDRFKHVNDTLGHEVGDRLLIAVADRLARHEPPDGVVGRLGGDEFAILVPGLSRPEQAYQFASQVLATLNEPMHLDGLLVDITASIGVACYPEQGGDFATLMRHADVAMYEAKRRGDAAVGYEATADENGPQRLSLLSDFRRALEVRDRDEVALHYQPQVDLATQKVVGVEALLRWRHPTRGLVSTADLLHVAEHTTVMQLLTMRVIDEVVAQVARWRAAGLTLRASLNVSARDLYNTDVVAQLAGRLRDHRVPPEQIQLEITESALMGDVARAQTTIAHVSDLGVAVALDDFGTGYSSLQHLRKLPLTEIKIDRSFVGGMAGNSDDAAIVRSTVELARALGLRTVAEGVENEYTWRMLQEVGCTVAQGYFTARPMPGADLPGWLAGYSAARIRKPLTSA